MNFWEISSVEEVGEKEGLVRFSWGDSVAEAIWLNATNVSLVSWIVHKLAIAQVGHT